MRYKPREACQYLGIDLDILRSATKKRDIGHIKLSPHRTVYEKADLDGWKATWKRFEPIIKEAE